MLRTDIYKEFFYWVVLSMEISNINVLNRVKAVTFKATLNITKLKQLYSLVTQTGRELSLQKFFESSNCR